MEKRSHLKEIGIVVSGVSAEIILAEAKIKGIKVVMIDTSRKEQTSLPLTPPPMLIKPMPELKYASYGDGQSNRRERRAKERKHKKQR